MYDTLSRHVEGVSKRGQWDELDLGDNRTIHHPRVDSCLSIWRPEMTFLTCDVECNSSIGAVLLSWGNGSLAPLLP